MHAQKAALLLAFGIHNLHNYSTTLYESNHNSCKCSGTCAETERPFSTRTGKGALALLCASLSRYIWRAQHLSGEALIKGGMERLATLNASSNLGAIAFGTSNETQSLGSGHRAFQGVWVRVEGCPDGLLILLVLKCQRTASTHFHGLSSSGIVVQKFTVCPSTSSEVLPASWNLIPKPPLRGPGLKELGVGS